MERLLNSEETDQGVPGTAGSLGPRTEQFALGSLFYLINYGFEVYDDQRLVDDPYEHGPKVMELLQDMKFPKLNGDPLIDNIIDKCWHNRYRTLAELATQTDILRREPTSEPRNHEAASTFNDCHNVNQDRSGESSLKKQEFCQGLEKRGLPRLLTSGKPTELGFSMEHRYVSPTTAEN